MPSGVFWVVASIIIVMIAAVILFIGYKFIYGFVTPFMFGGRCAGAIAQYRFDTFIFPAILLYDTIFGGQINYNSQASSLQSACLVTGRIAALTPYSFASELYSYASACYGLFNQQNSGLTNKVIQTEDLHDEFECFLGSISGNNPISINQVENYIQRDYFNPESPLKIVILTNYTNNGVTYGVYPNSSFIIKPNASISITYIYYDSKRMNCVPQNYFISYYPQGLSSSSCSSNKCMTNGYSSLILGNSVGQPNVSIVCPGTTFSGNSISSKCENNLSYAVLSDLPPQNSIDNSPIAGCIANYTYPKTIITGYKYFGRAVIPQTTTILLGSEYNISVPFCGNVPLSAINGESRVIICIT